MKTSQLKSFFAFLLLAAVTFTSCKKDDPQTQQSDPMVGIWDGKYAAGQGEPNTQYTFKLNANGTMQILDFDKTVLGSGTWSLNETTFTGKYTYELGGNFSMVAKYDAAAKTLTGSWGEDQSTGDGTFFLKKQ